MPENRPGIPADIQRQVLIEAGHRCAACGDHPIERAHIIAWSRSKDHSAENLLCLCANCHERSHKENWSEETLREYKRRPWVIRARTQEDAGYRGGVSLPPKHEALTRLEVLVHRHSNLDSVFLVPAFSSNKPHDVLIQAPSAEVPPDRDPDLTLLVAFLSDIEVINHDDKPTELLRLWVGINNPETQDEIAPREVREEELTGTRRIEARSRRRYRLHFKAVFREVIPQQNGPQRVLLHAKTIGLGAQQVTLVEAFFPCREGAE